MSDKPKNLSDIDNFWDLNSLLPKKRPVAPTHRAVNTDTVELELTRSDAAPVSAAHGDIRAARLARSAYSLDAQRSAPSE